MATIQAKALRDPELKRALITVFLAPPSMAVLTERLKKRGLDAPAEVEKRLNAARQELAQAGTFDYVIISGSVAEDARRMQAIVEAEKLRQNRVRLPSYECS